MCVAWPAKEFGAHSEEETQETQALVDSHAGACWEGRGKGLTAGSDGHGTSVVDCVVCLVCLCVMWVVWCVQCACMASGCE